MGVLHSQLVPMAERPGYVRGIGEGLLIVVFRALHIVEKKPGTPLPVPLVRHIRIESPRSNPSLKFVSAQSRRGTVRTQRAVWVKKKLAVAVQELRSPRKPLKLVVPQ